MSPDQITNWIFLANTLYKAIDGIVAHLRANGVTDEEMAAVSDDYRKRIERRDPNGV